MGNRRFEHRAGIRRTWAAMALGLVLLAGCATTPWSLPSSSRLNSATGDVKETSPTPPKSSGSPADTRSLEQVMSELQQFMALDRAAQDKLMADLKQVDPSLQPMALQAFLADAADKRREVEREAEKQVQQTTAPDSPRKDPDARTTIAVKQETRLELNVDNGLALSPELPLTGGIDSTSTTTATAVERPSEACTAPAAPHLPDAGGTPAPRMSVTARLAAIREEESAADTRPPSKSDWQAHLTAAILSVQQPDAGHRATEATRILGEALAQLGETAPLAVRNLTFCSEVFRFGSFDALKSPEFTPGQKVLLYAEVDNLHVESSAKGLHWAVKVNGRIFDNRGQRMVDYGSTSAEEYYQTPRHDFFVSKLYYLPRLVPGRYSLQLVIDDTLGHKTGQSSIDFKIKAARISTEK